MAIVLAVLYFGLVELILLDSQRELAEARRFRARIVAETLAENAAELAALQLVDRIATPHFSVPTEQGTLIGNMTKPGNEEFILYGEGVTSGITESRARVTVHGRIQQTTVPKKIWIHYSYHH